MTMSSEEKRVGPPISNGQNARPRDESIAQTAGGIPNDSEKPVEVSPQEEERIRRALLRN